MKINYKKSQPPIELTVSEGVGFQATDFKAQAVSVPCQTGCPAGTNVPGYIEKIAQGDYDGAYAINLEDNVMPGVLGRICVKPCQSKCRHNWSDINGSVEICYLKRSAADRIQYEVTLPQPYFEPTTHKVAVIGGGPAGLAAARELKRYGHSVTLFEKESYLGGMLVDGIPRYRLPQNVIDVEIRQVIESGIEVVTGSAIDQAGLNNLLKDYDAVILATGTVLPNSLELENLEPNEVLTGLEFMKLYNQGKITGPQKASKSLQNEDDVTESDTITIKGDVVIIGGGFTAVDSARSSARTARKILGKDGTVSVVYRRSLEFMAADQKELDEMAEEHIDIKTLLSPVKVIKEKGKLSAVVFQKNYLKRSEQSGKPEMIPVEGAFVEMPCNHLVIAIGQKQDYRLLPEDVQVLENYATSEPKLFAIGDFYSGSLDVIHAIADGKNVSAIVDTFLVGKERLRKGIQVEKGHSNGENNRRRAHDVQRPTQMNAIPVAKRVSKAMIETEGQKITVQPEVQVGFSDDQTALHATRCYFCHYKFQIDQDKCIHCNWCIDVTPRKCIQKVASFDKDADGIITQVNLAQTDEEASFIWIDSEQCIRCGKCLRTCPVSAIEMVKTTVVNCKE